jgi:hypothetical protein
VSASELWIWPDEPPAYEAGPLERELPERLVVIGDLNAQAESLVRLLRGLRLIRKSGAWCGGRTVLVQLGDVPNRGPGARASMEILLRLAPEARAAGGDVVWLLGNHEVLSVLRHEAYVSAEEYLEFATPLELEQFYEARAEAVQRMLIARASQLGHIPPLGGELKAWEELHAPGQLAYRAAMGAEGSYGRAIRRLPIAVRFGPLLFVHAGLSPEWATVGLDGLERSARITWAEEPEFYAELDPDGILRDPEGPLWHREYCLGAGRVVRDELLSALELTEARQMVVGHTRSDAVKPSAAGRPLARFAERLIMADVGIGDPGEPGCALVVERRRIETWTPGGSRSRLADVKPGRV